MAATTAPAHPRFRASEGVQDALEAVRQLDDGIKQALGTPGVELLQQMARLAPGTLFHSMRVLEMMRAAGYAQFSDEAAAVLVHDCGKLCHPKLFAENGGHTSPSPTQIKQHVDHGIEIGEKVGLSSLQMSAISEHHGRQKLSRPGEADAQYEGPVPQTMFTAVLMMADTMEAITAGAGVERAKQLLMGICEQRIQQGEFDVVGHDAARAATAKLIEGQGGVSI